MLLVTKGYIYHNSVTCCYHGEAKSHSRQLKNNNRALTNCDKRTIEDTLCILRTKNMIDENVKLISGNQELVDNDISPTPLPGRPNTFTKDTNKISGIVLNHVKKELMQHVNSRVENLKPIIDNEFTTLKNQVLAPVFLQNENPNSKSNISSANNEKKKT